MIVQGEGVMKWVEERNDGDFGKKYAAIGQIRHNKLIAGVVYDKYTGKNVVCTLAVDEPPTRTFWAAAAHFAFGVLGCDRVTAYVEDSNTKSVRVTTKAGFVQEALLSGASADGGNILIFRMLKDTCHMLDWRK